MKLPNIMKRTEFSSYQRAQNRFPTKDQESEWHGTAQQQNEVLKGSIKMSSKFWRKIISSLEFYSELIFNQVREQDADIKEGNVSNFFLPSSIRSQLMENMLRSFK